MKYKMTRYTSGVGITSSITPACSCGWTGRPEYAHNDWQMTNLKEQEAKHINKHKGN